MSIIDKRNLLNDIKDLDHVVFELGCGSKKSISFAIGVDAINYNCVDIVGDVFDVLAALPNNSIDELYSFHFFEHIEDLNRLLAGIARVLKPNGKLEVVVPHFSNPYFYSDSTHRRFFGLYTFCYFANASPFARQVPTYSNKLEFEIASVDLIFKSARPFFVRYGIKKFIGSIFNSCNYLKELYEENFCYLFPCYEVRYRLRRKDGCNA